MPLAVCFLLISKTVLIYQLFSPCLWFIIYVLCLVASAPLVFSHGLGFRINESSFCVYINLVYAVHLLHRYGFSDFDSLPTCMLMEMNQHQMFWSGSTVIGQKLTSLMQLVLLLYIGIHWEQRLVTEFLLCRAFSFCAESCKQIKRWTCTLVGTSSSTEVHGFKLCQNFLHFFSL